MRKPKTKYLIIFAIICYIFSAIMMFQGFDKMCNYSNGIIKTNVYVGGDAYNYIINGTYSTAFFVLAIGFFISGTLSVIGAKIIDAITASKDDPKMGISLTDKIKAFFSYLKNHKRLVSSLFAILLIIIFIVVGCKLIIHYFHERELKIQEQRNAEYAKLSTSFYSLESSLSALKKEKNKEFNSESLVTKNVNTFYSRVQEVDELYNSSDTEVKKLFDNKVQKTWSEYQVDILEKEYFYCENEKDTVQKIIDFKKSKAEENFDNVSEDMSISDVIKLLGNNYKLTLQNEYRLYSWDDKFNIKAKGGIVVEKWID